MTALALYWSDNEWNVHWNAAADAHAAFRLAVDIASFLGNAQRVSYRAGERAAEGVPEDTADALTDLWRDEQQLEGSLTAAEMQFVISAITESGGGQLSLESRDGVFGTRFDELVAMLTEYARRRGIRIAAPLQDMSFGA